MRTDHDVVIAGGGLNGPALALALAQGGLSVAVADPRPAPVRAQAGFDGRVYAMALASRRLLTALGVWADLAPDAQPIAQVRATQGWAGDGSDPFGLIFDGAEIEEGAVGHMVEDRHLSRVLTAAMTARGIVHLPGRAVTAQAPDDTGVTVTLSDGATLRARLLVGADGRGSGVAARAGIRRVGHGYGQTALVATVAHARPHQGIAHQFFMPAGPLAILPLTGDRSSVVWSETDAGAAAIAALDDDGFLDVLRPRFGDFLGDLRLAGPRFSYPLSLSLAEVYAVPRIALVGDAAHGVHPVAGQGLNLGLRDVAALAEVLVTSARRGEDIGTGAVLARYDVWRRPDATVMALGMDAVQRLFASTNPLVRAVRGLGMGAVTAMPPVRRAFMRQAAGLSVAPMPRLLTGRAP